MSRTRLAAKGRQRVLENYTQEQIARQTYEVYKEMLVQDLGCGQALH